MADDGSLEKVAGNTLGKVIDLAKDSPEMQEAGRSVARSVRTVATVVEIALLPVAAVTYGYSKARTYFQDRFAADIEEATKEVPPEEIVEPSPSVAAPALQALAFSHEEPDLKSMYLNLLRNAMDGRTEGSVHPAFVEVIRQLSPEEARLFNQLPDTRTAIVALRRKTTGGFDEVRKHILPLARNGQPAAAPEFPAMLDNWERLGLVSVDYTTRLVDEQQYEWVEARPEYIEMTSRGDDVDVVKGMLELSAFGRSFKQTVS